MGVDRNRPQSNMAGKSTVEFDDVAIQKMPPVRGVPAMPKIAEGYPPMERPWGIMWLAVQPQQKNSVKIEPFPNQRSWFGPHGLSQDGPYRVSRTQSSLSRPVNTIVNLPSTTKPQSFVKWHQWCSLWALDVSRSFVMLTGSENRILLPLFEWEFDADIPRFDGLSP